MISSVAAAVIGVPLVVAAVLAAVSKNLVRALLWLALVLGGTAVLFVLLGAGFLATIQVLVYIGGLVTLLIFGVMLVHRAGDAAIPRPVRRVVPAAIVSIALFAALAAAILEADLGTPAAGPPDGEALATTLLGKDLLAFEVLSVLLLAAMIGAIVLARARDAGSSPRQRVPDSP